MPPQEGLRPAQPPARTLTARPVRGRVSPTVCSEGTAGSAERQGEVEGGALVLPALRPDPTAVLLHEPPADGEAQAGPRRLQGRRPPEAPERLEEVRQRLGPDAGPGVGDGHVQRTRLALDADQ